MSKKSFRILHLFTVSYLKEVVMLKIIPSKPDNLVGSFTKINSGYLESTGKTFEVVNSSYRITDASKSLQFP